MEKNCQNCDNRNKAWEYACLYCDDEGVKTPSRWETKEKNCSNCRHWIKYPDDGIAGGECNMLSQKSASETRVMWGGKGGVFRSMPTFSCSLFERKGEE